MGPTDELNLTSLRYKRAHTGKQIGSTGYLLELLIGLTLLVIGAIIAVTGTRLGYSAMGVGLFLNILALWWKRDLSVVPVEGKDFAGRLHVDVLKRLKKSTAYSPATLWQDIQSDWQSLFFCHHLLIMPDLLSQQLSPDPMGVAPVLATAAQLADATHCEAIEAGHITAALILTSPATMGFLTDSKLGPNDVASVMSWLGHDLEAMRRPRPSFGGVGRDWASGFTPRLDRFGQNLSLSIEKSGAHFGSLVDSPGVEAVKAAFSQGAAAIALIGPDGIGKTSNAYALAQNLLAENKDPRLEHRQIIALSPTSIISAAQRPGELEFIVTTLLNEAAHAGNIILFLDDAQLFFQSGPGSFNATQILLPVIQARHVQFVLAMSPNDFQQLKNTNMAFAGLLMPVVLQEPPEHEVLDVLCDNATKFELRHKVLITWPEWRHHRRLGAGSHRADHGYQGRHGGTGRSHPATAAGG
jgi:hypothetical protein